MRSLRRITATVFVAIIALAGSSTRVFDQFVYVANYDSNSVSAFTIDASTGALTQITGSPFAAKAYPYYVTVDPLGRYVYVANRGTSDGVCGDGCNISVFTINPSTGALAEISGSPFAAGLGPTSVAFVSSGSFAYVTNVFPMMSRYSAWM